MMKEYSAFKYPLWLTGIWMPEVQRVSLWIGVTIVGAGAGTIWLRQSGLWLAVLILSISATVLVTPTIGRMARYVSIADPFPWGKETEPSIMRQNLPLAIMLLLSNVAGPVFSLWLTRADDPIPIRLVRIVAIELVVLILSMVMGGAIACSHTEGRKGIESVGRMLHLILCQKGLFLRAVVYGLPLWLFLCLVDVVVFSGALLLPFLISHYGLSTWLIVLGPVPSLLVRIIRFIGLVVVGLLLVIFWSIMIAAPNKRELPITPKWRLGLIVALCSTVWAFWAMPLLHLSASLPGLLPAGDWLRDGRIVMPSTALRLVGLGLIGIGISWALAKRVGIWLFLYPAAYGVFAFFHLRHEAEGTPHRSPSDPKAAIRRSGFSNLGGILFKTGTQSALDSFLPPRGWAPLLWLPYAPRILVPSCILVLVLMLCNLPVTWLHGAWRVLWLCTSVLALALMFFPILSRSVIRYLVTHKEPDLSIGRLAGRAAIMFLIYVAFSLVILLPLALCGTLATFPLVGPVLWAVLYAVYFVPCGIMATQFLLFLGPGMLMLSPLVAHDAHAKWDQLATCLDNQTGAFLGATLCGLLVTGAPVISVVLLLMLYARAHIVEWYEAFGSVLGIVPFYSLSPLQLTVAIGICGLCISALSAATTNAYLTLRGPVK